MKTPYDLQQLMGISGVHWRQVLLKCLLGRLGGKKGEIQCENTAPTIPASELL